MKKSLLFVSAILLSACSGKDALQVTRGILGYQEPPEKTSVSEELKLEYQRCVKIDPERIDCAQAAFDVVRKVKGLEPRVIPEGYVIILQGDGGHTEDSDQSKEDEQATPSDKAGEDSEGEEKP